MGFKDTKWAYSLDELTASQVAVLAAVCHMTDDKTHQTYASQKTLAGMAKVSVATVNTVLGVLASRGIITRTRRNGIGGYRTTDIITIVLTYINETYVGETNIGDTYVGLTGNLHQTDGPPTSTSLLAEEINQRSTSDQPEERARKRATRIPDDFTVTSEMVLWARGKAPLVDGPRATEKFINYWTAASGRTATKLDWPATWRNWMLREQEHHEQRDGSRKPTDTERVASILALVPDTNIQEISA